MGAETETVGQWKLRKGEQAFRLIERMPRLKADMWQDYGTKFVMVDHERLFAVVFGQLPWNDRDQPRIDLSDDEVIEQFSKAPT